MNSIIVNALEVLLFVLNKVILNDKLDEVFSLHQLFIVYRLSRLILRGIYYI